MIGFAHHLFLVQDEIIGDVEEVAIFATNSATSFQQDNLLLIEVNEVILTKGWFYKNRIHWAALDKLPCTTIRQILEILLRKLFIKGKS